MLLQWRLLLLLWGSGMRLPVGLHALLLWPFGLRADILVDWLHPSTSRHSCSWWKLAIAIATSASSKTTAAKCCRRRCRHGYGGRCGVAIFGRLLQALQQQILTRQQQFIVIRHVLILTQLHCSCPHLRLQQLPCGQGAPCATAWRG